jgi:phosphomevalonate kinase
MTSSFCHIAGGYDAVFCIVIGEQTLKRVSQFWNTLHSSSHHTVCALLATVSSQGLRLESSGDFNFSNKL